MYSLVGKRVFDIVLAALLVALTAPWLIVISVLVRTRMGRPVLFRQIRPGVKGKPFLIYKFRTMSNTEDCFGNLLPDHRRLSHFGKLLRGTSMDELPELFNVFKGEMSLVGPRPLLMQYLSRYNVRQARRHEIKPGITGWAQINGRNAISWDEKLDMDVWYVDNMSFRLDIRILLITLTKVLLREGISQNGHVTAEEFMGSSCDE